MNELCTRIGNILQFDSQEITFRADKGDLIVDLDCYAISGTAARRISELAQKESRSFIITIQSIDCPKIQLQISL